MVPDPCKTILVVDDNEIEREGLISVLQKEGFDVMTAGNGAEALCRLLDGKKPDAMLLDMLMPHYDGWKLLDKLRRDPAHKSVPVIIITGLDVASQEWAMSLGASGLVEKPISADLLREQLEKVFHDGGPALRC
jgi:CheY-like chemotaxis protein